MVLRMSIEILSSKLSYTQLLLLTLFHCLVVLSLSLHSVILDAIQYFSEAMQEHFGAGAFEHQVSCILVNYFIITNHLKENFLNQTGIGDVGLLLNVTVKVFS